MTAPAQPTGLRVLMVGPYPPPYGGIASLLVSLVAGLQDGRADEVVTMNFGAEDKTTTVGRATIYSFAIRKHAWRALLPQNWSMVLHTFQALGSARMTTWVMMQEAVKAILVDTVASRHRCNVVSFYQSDVSLELLACRRKWGKRRGIALKVFGEIYDAPEFIRPRGELFRAVLAAPDEVTSSSAHCAKSFRELDVQREIGVVYVGVDLDRFRDDPALRKQQREALGVADEETPVLLFMGRFNSRMGLDGLLATIPGLAKSGTPYKVILAGAKGDLTPQALECEKAYPNVKVMNDVPGKLLPALYAASDIVITPSRDQHACMGVTIKEAMAASRPVIGTDSGGIPEAIAHGKTGLVVPLAHDGSIDVPALEYAILSLMPDRKRRDEMGRAGRARAEALFGEDVTVNRSTEVFRRCMPRG